MDVAAVGLAGGARLTDRLGSGLGRRSKAAASDSRCPQTAAVLLP